MTKRDMANLLFKAFAIYSFLAALQNLPYFIYDLQKLQGSYFLALGAPMITMTAAGILLWFLSGRASRLIFGQEDSDINEPASGKDIRAIARSLVGLYLVAIAGPELITDVVLFVCLFLWGNELKNVVTTLLYPAARLVIGFWLLLGTKDMVAFIQKTRGAGRVDHHVETDRE